jgi:flavin reductase (DIM6/NTAB) family NADH-FMN oxidoreductase RutF
MLVTSAHGDHRNAMVTAWAMSFKFYLAPRVAIVIEKNTLSRELVAVSGASGLCAGNFDRAGEAFPARPL